MRLFISSLPRSAQWAYAPLAATVRCPPGKARVRQTFRPEEPTPRAPADSGRWGQESSGHRSGHHSHSAGLPERHH